MLDEGLFKELKPDAVFGLHVLPGRSGELFYRSGATMASSDDLQIRVIGKQGHGGMPWNTIDPVTTSALIISGLQTIVSRRTNLAVSPAVITIGSIHGGTGPNVIPERVDMAGTIRTYDENRQESRLKTISGEPRRDCTKRACQGRGHYDGYVCHHH